MSSTRLSHSSLNRYLSCPKSYELHYLKRLRPTKQSAALLFGSAIDKASEVYASTRDILTATFAFNKTWLNQKINDVETDLRTCTDIVYSNSDIDTELLSSFHWDAMEIDRKVFELAVSKKDSDGFDNLSKGEKLIINRVAWECMSFKGMLMITKFAEIFDENVEEVLGSQVPIDLTNEEGDAVTGFADFVFKWKGREQPIVFDLKTSGIRYEDDSVLTSPQLTLYVHGLREKFNNTNTAGYLVLHKRVIKNKTKVCKVCNYNGTGKNFKTCNNDVNGSRCGGEWNEVLRPEIGYQVIIDDIPSILEERVLENFTEVNHGIKSQVFPRNFSSCIKYNGTVTCEFYNLCHHKDGKGLCEKTQSN
jgi:hypothetical protein